VEKIAAKAHSREYLLKRRLSTVDFFIKIGCFAKEKNIVLV
jgi:hypothetical protein